MAESMVKMKAEREEKEETESKKKTEQQAWVIPKAKEKPEVESKLKFEQETISKAEEDESRTIDGEVATHMAEARVKVNFEN